MSKSISPEEYTKWGKWMGETEQNVSKDDFVSRKAALNALSRGSGCGASCHRAIKNLPSADVHENIRGSWFTGFGHAYCNICGYKSSPVLTNYCPNCGARMDGEKNG